MSELPPDFPEVNETGAPVDAPDSGGADTNLAVPGGHEAFGGGTTLVEDTPGEAFGELEEDGGDVVDISYKDDDADLLGDGPDGSADVFYPTFGKSLAEAADTNEEHEGTRVATIHDIANETVPEEKVEAGNSFGEEIEDTPGAGRDYPIELLDITDVLMGQGEAGEAEAMRLLEEYDDSQSALVIPKQPASSEDGESDITQSDMLF